MVVVQASECPLPKEVRRYAVSTVCGRRQAGMKRSLLNREKSPLQTVLHSLRAQSMRGMHPAASKLLRKGYEWRSICKCPIQFIASSRNL